MPNPTVVSDYASRLESISKILNTCADRSSPLLKQFAQFAATDVINTKHEWVNRTLVTLRDVLNANITNSATTVVTRANANSPARYIPNVSILTIGDEQMLVTAVTVGVSTTTLTVTRGVQGSTAAAATAGAGIAILNPRVEGFLANRDDSQYGVRAFNYSQIFERQLKLSGTSQAIKTVGDENKVYSQMELLTLEIMKELENAVIRSSRYIASNDTQRQMGGLIWWAKQVGNSSNQGSNAITTTMLDNLIESYAQNGGDVGKMCLILPYKQQRKINELKASRIISGGMSQSEKTLTNAVDRYDFNGSASIKFILSTDLFPDEIIVCQEDKIAVKPLTGRAWQKEDLAKTGDSSDSMILGEYTLEVKNPKETLFYYNGLSVA
jgi:hypothetical protein